MDNVEPQVIARINELAANRFQLEVKRDAENRRFQAALAELTRAHEEKLQEFAEHGRQMDLALWQHIDANRPTLIARSKRSFVTMLAKFQLKEVPAKVDVLDKVSVMETARRLGVVKQIANPPRGEWRFNHKKFLAWLTKNGEMREHFEPFLDHIDKGESLTIQPNATYTIEHDSERISPPSISIKKS